MMRGLVLVVVAGAVSVGAAEAPDLVLWPMPTVLQVDTQPGCLKVPPALKFTISPPCPVVERSAKRYLQIMQRGSALAPGWQCDGSSSLTEVQVKVLRPDAELVPGVDETYTLVLDTHGAVITAATPYGAMWGLETLSQMVYEEEDGGLAIPVTGLRVEDGPRFEYRGFLVDTGRHWLAPPVMDATLDLMAYNKMNVLHWHLTDDQNFPFGSTSHPELQKGAFDPTKIYTHEILQQFISRAHDRGIRMIVEFDMPGHSGSWGKGAPWLLSDCPSVQSHRSHPMDPTKDETYSLVTDVLAEAAEVFPDPWMFIGGDEVNPDCWTADPTIKKWMDERNIPDVPALQAYFEEKMLGIVTKAPVNRTAVVYEEVFWARGTRSFPPDTIVEVWLGNATTTRHSMETVVRAGYRSIFTNVAWYLDHWSYAGEPNLEGGCTWWGDWPSFYDVDPLKDTTLTPEQQKMVLGGDVCNWGLYEDASNAISNAWPRASAGAERLWTALNRTNVDLDHRLHEFRCRLLRRGVPVAPSEGMSSQSFCPQDPLFYYEPPYHLD